MLRVFLLLVLLPLCSLAQVRQTPDAASIKLKLKKLNFLGSVLYVAAHPDDENTRIITAMANDRLAATAYLSMTRGDGGQNLIGPEIRDLLGLIRTQELIAARRIDGGKQFFTRANDFGYSKSAEETFRIWGKDSILHDVIKVFRQFQPDVIITRFPADERAGHGHHTASAMLAQEAFDLSAQPSVYPHVAKAYGVWQPRRLLTNTGRWWNNSINENTPGILVIDVGTYSPLLGYSLTELAAHSRSQHKSQGFGSAGSRGRQLEFLEPVKGDAAQKDIFEGVNTTWSRLKGGEKIQPLVNRIITKYQEDQPNTIISDLLNLRKEILKLEKSTWRDRKAAEVAELIEDCTGLFVEITSPGYWIAPGENLQVNAEVVNRTSSTLSLRKVSIPALGFDTTLTYSLKTEIPLLFKTVKQLPSTVSYSDPYWLTHPHSVGMFTVKDHEMIGKPENTPAIEAIFEFTSGTETIQVKRPLIYKWTDPVKGELTRPFEIVPPVFVNLQEDVFVFPDEKPRSVNVLLKSSSKTSISGELILELPQGWRSEPASIPFSLAKTGEEQTKTFQVFPSGTEMTASLQAKAVIGEKEYRNAITVISYDHFPIQTLLPPATAKLVRLNLGNTGGTIAYLKGAGDDVPAGLRNMGFNVWEMKNEEVTPDNLKKVDAVVLGIRALNTNERIRFMMDALLEYVKKGGTVIVQYNTSFDLETDTFTPYPLTISRDRVSEEDAEVRILKPDHRVLNYPNQITTADFKDWVQERGLYFPGKWDPAFEAILSMNDKNEKPKDGSLLVAKYGEGYYVYTGLSFFRELPEGVPGAYRLFANLVSLSKKKDEPVIQQETIAPTKKKRKSTR